MQLGELLASLQQLLLHVRQHDGVGRVVYANDAFHDVGKSVDDAVERCALPRSDHLGELV